MKTGINLGVIVGRFQVHQLHAGHRHLIDYVQRNRSKTMVLVGSTLGLPSQRDPLDFETRKRMILEEYPNAIVAEIFDKPRNEDWSRQVDNIIDESCNGAKSITLFGSRDSFIGAYSGKHIVRAIPHVPSASGTKIRADIKPDFSKDEESFRMGMIHAQNTRLAISYQTIDVIIVNDNKEVLLGQKNIDGDKYRFVGGFVEPKHTSLENTVQCELNEEVPGIETDLHPVYIGSARINDRRYRDADDGILTSLFVTKYIFGTAAAGDDLDNVAWIPIDQVRNNLLTEHRLVWDTFQEKIEETFSHYAKY
ncbi:MAG: NUDIX domain-containing protein [Candidatus Nomurabacteria bacterium]|nr:NUDIX domain-containing protein [Candidatus Nomurabacteria bacterium]